MLPEQGRYERMLAAAGRLTAGAVEGAIRTLGVPAGSSVIDVGCGIGTDLPRLAHATGSTGGVIGVDREPWMLREARHAAEQCAIGSGVQLVGAEVAALPFADEQFDMAWSRDVIWGHDVEPTVAVAELARVVCSGGAVGLAYWSGHALLPGFPELEARAMAAWAESAPYTAGMAPDRHYARALGWLRAAGMVQVTARAHTVTLCGPLRVPDRADLATVYEMLYDDLTPRLASTDDRLLQRLTSPESPEFLGDRTDFCGHVTYLVVTGTVV